MRIFLSYSRVDGETATQIAGTLKDAGYEVFFDKQQISPGEAYSSRILAAIERSDVFLYLASESSTSESSFARLELGLALEQSKTRSISILPIILPHFAITRLPPEVAHLSAIEAFSHSPTEVLAAVRRVQSTKLWLKRALWLLPLATLSGLAFSFVFLGAAGTLLKEVLRPDKQLQSIYMSYVHSTVGWHALLACLSSCSAIALFKFFGGQAIRRYLIAISIAMGLGTAVGIFIFSHRDLFGIVNALAAASAGQLVTHLLVWRKGRRSEA